MSRKPPPGKCIHCCNHAEDRNWDHVFPESWYPIDTPTDLEKWKIPSCIECNREYGKLEQALLVRLALCLDPSSPKNRGIIDRAMRAIEPERGRDEIDRRARAAKRKKIAGDVLIGAGIPNEGIYPGLGERWYRPVEHRAAITVEAHHIRRFCEKIVRGITYLESGEYIELPHAIEFFALTEEGAQAFKEPLDKFGKTLSRGPGIEVRRAIAPEDNISGIYEISIFGQFVMYATVTRDG